MMGFPNYTVKPYEYIEEWLEDHDVTQAELARRMDVSPKHITKLKQGDTLTVDTARKLEYVTDIPVRFWMRAEALYRDDVARLQEAQELEKVEIPIADKALTELRKRGIISSTKRAGQKGFLCQELMRFFRVGSWPKLLANLQLEHQPSIAYKQTEKTDKAAVSIWLQLGMREFEKLPNIGAYDEEALRRLIPDLRALTIRPPEHFGARLVELLNSVGVYLIYVEDLPGTGTFGATRWVDDRPVIQLSLRNKREDIFWFTLFHEIGHVLLHATDGVFVNIDSDDKPVTEREADTYASDVLIPRDIVERLRPSITLAEIDRIAAQAGVAPGIIVGRCHHEGYLPHNTGQRKIRRLEIRHSDDGSE